MYILLILGAFLFAIQFLFNQQYQRIHGDGIESAVTFALFTSAISFLQMLVVNGFKLDVTWFSLILAVCYAAVFVSCTYCGLKSFGTANLSVYSIFMMLGGMLVPFAYGILFANEPFTAAKAGCIVLIGIAVGLSFEKGKSSKKCYIYYFAIFILNGLYGVISKIHSDGANAVDSESFMALVWLSVFVLCVIWRIVGRQGMIKVTGKECAFMSAYALCNGTAELLLLIALATLPASVQYPIVTGGVMVFSTIISLARKEAVSKKTLVATLMALLSTILIMY